MECNTISYREVCYIVNRLGIYFSVHYRPNTSSYQIQLFIITLMFSSFNSQSRYNRSSFVSFSSSFSMFPFSTHFNIQSVILTQLNRRPVRRKHALRSRTFGVEKNLLLHGMQRCRSLPSVIHHIPSVSVLQEKVTTCRDHLGATYRKRGHFLCSSCVEHA
jgi:hypothetical protein